MGVMPIIIILSLFVAGGFAIAFVISTQHGQYDDTRTPPVRMLFDDDLVDASVDADKETTHFNSHITNNLHGRVR
ncbi:MAG: cbb3-type cytochrome oxidase assembly protein CcoS [Candidatus Kapabacteria bacterium]|nr:cbb3-type cytochrome oxidase assembly protein CcoS [Candidatus Kapabacteria bacterium]